MLMIFSAVVYLLLSLLCQIGGIEAPAEIICEAETVLSPPVVSIMVIEGKKNHLQGLNRLIQCCHSVHQRTSEDLIPTLFPPRHHCSCWIVSSIFASHSHMYSLLPHVICKPEPEQQIINWSQFPQRPSGGYEGSWCGDSRMKTH